MTVTRLGITIRAISGTAARLASISGIFIIGASDVSEKHMYQRTTTAIETATRQIL